MADTTRNESAVARRPDPSRENESNGDSTVPGGGMADRFAALADTGSGSGAGGSGGSTPLAAMPDPPPGFEIEREIGRGGMGLVYLARQHGLNRQVALKMVAGTASPKALIRFLAEAEAIAAVRHPNVVEVYQFGDHAGRPYLALEYCSGGDLDQRVKAGRLTPPSAATLMAGVADGVQAAHAAGIVHRDLKPHNVLLAADGTPKVSDFGLAKKGFGSDLTNTDAVMGTPAYMSPEQAAGGTKFVGPEADVWALGVILYELLTGDRPFDAPDRMGLLVQVMAGDVPPLRAKAPDVPRDLELIAGKCLRREPRERYATAGELSTDLRNWLAGKPIAARPVGTIEGAVKWARRNKPLAGAVAAAAVALVVGTAVSVWQAIRAESRRQDAETAREREKDQRTKAEANLKLASRAVDDCYNAVTNNRLLQGDRMKAVRGLLYGVALPYYREFTRVAPDDPALLADHARNLDRVVQITQALGSSKVALEVSEELVAARERLAAGGDPAAKKELALALLTRGNLFRVVGQSEQSVTVLREAIDRLLALPDDEARLEAARALRSLGISLRDLSRRDESVAACEQAIRLLEEMRSKHPSAPRYKLPLATTHGILGYTHALLTSREEGGREKAKAGYEAQQRLARELLAADPTNPKYATELANALSNAGILYLRLYDDPAKARELYTESRGHYRRLADASPDELGHLTGLAGALGNLANTCTGAEARQYTDEARQAFEKALALDPENARLRTHHSLTLADIGQSLLNEGDARRALDHFVNSLDGLRAVYAKDPGDYYNRDYMTHVLTLQGETLVALGRPADAHAPLDEAVKLAEEFLRGQGKGHVKYIGRLSDAYGGRAALHRAEKEPAAAAAVTRKRLPLCEQLGESATRKDHLFSAAEGFAACVPLAATDAERTEYADAALNVLRDAVKFGFTDAAKLTASKDLAPVRDRDDFKHLLASLPKPKAETK
jgi:tetratricopeptide (TPR) repeat protein